MNTDRHPVSVLSSQRRAAFEWLLLLAPLFVSTYWLANHITASRPDVGAVVFAWEYAIPFIPWTIVPYWSIDVLYVLSLFVCKNRAELDTHAWRLASAQLIAVACFLLFPLRFTFDRPEVDGTFGALFGALASFDRPYNQAPSLHVALLVILWVRYAHHIAEAWHWALHAWFGLIGLSVLTTYQHHFVDIPTGLWLGWFCVWLIPEHESKPARRFSLSRDPHRRRLAARYGIAALALGILALQIGGAGLWLLWVAGALGLVGLIYVGMGASAFYKRRDGSIGAAFWWLCWPYLLGIRAHARWRTRHCRRPFPVAPDFWLGPLPSIQERRRFGDATIVDLTAEVPCPALGAPYLHVPLLDLVAPSRDELQHAIRVIDKARATGPVWVCCALGLSRSATVAAAWLIQSEHLSAKAALAGIRKARPGIVITPSHWVALERLSHDLRSRAAAE